MELDRRELATVLAALRYWRREGLWSDGREREIATSDDKFDELSATEIDALCERLSLAGRGFGER